MNWQFFSEKEIKQKMFKKGYKRAKQQKIKNKQKNILCSFALSGMCVNFSSQTN